MSLAPYSLAALMVRGGRATSELLSSGSSELLSRLEELKALYKSHKEQLGVRRTDRPL